MSAVRLPYVRTPQRWTSLPYWMRLRTMFRARHTASSSASATLGPDEKSTRPRRRRAGSQLESRNKPARHKAVAPQWQLELDQARWKRSKEQGIVLSSWDPEVQDGQAGKAADMLR